MLLMWISTKKKKKKKKNNNNNNNNNNSEKKKKSDIERGQFEIVSQSHHCPELELSATLSRGQGAVGHFCVCIFTMTSSLTMEVEAVKDAMQRVASQRDTHTRRQRLDGPTANSGVWDRLAHRHAQTSAAQTVDSLPWPCRSQRE